MCVLGGVFAIIVVKQLFGGLGQNFMNPALGARCFLMLSFSSAMTNSFAIPKGNAIWGGYQATLDAVSRNECGLRNLLSVLLRFIAEKANKSNGEKN